MNTYKNEKRLPSTRRIDVTEIRDIPLKEAIERLQQYADEEKYPNCFLDIDTYYEPYDSSLSIGVWIEYSGTEDDLKYYRRLLREVENHHNRIRTSITTLESMKQAVPAKLVEQLDALQKEVDALSLLVKQAQKNNKSRCL